MTNFFNNSETLRSFIGVVAALLMGGTFLLAAAGPAVAPAGVNFAANSDIVSVA